MTVTESTPAGRQAQPEALFGSMPSDEGRSWRGGLSGPGAGPRIALSSIEELLVVLDAPAEPQNVRCEIELPGRLDPDRLREAARVVAAAEPRARVRLARWRACDRGLAWEVADGLDIDPVTTAALDDPESLAEAREELVGRPFNLDCSPPWRLGLLDAPDRTHLVLVAHHAAIDGLGAVHLSEMLAAAYAGNDVRPRPRRRAGFPVGGANTFSRVRSAARIASGLVHRTARVAAADAAHGTPGVHIDGIRLEAELTARLAGPRARHRPIDLLLTAGILAIDRWNLSHGHESGRIALLHAVGVPAGPGASPLANAWAPLVISLSGRQRAAARRVELVAKQRRCGLAGLRAPAAKGERPSSPMWLKQMAVAVHPMTGQRLAESAALTSLGRVGPFDFGAGLRSQAFWFDGPARLPKGLFICPSLHADELHIALRSARAQLGRAALRRFGEVYVDTLLSLI